MYNKAYVYQVLFLIVIRGDWGSIDLGFKNYNFSIHLPRYIAQGYSVGRYRERFLGLNSHHNCLFFFKSEKFKYSFMHAGVLFMLLFLPPSPQLMFALKLI